jgi:hypothetical protein
MFNMSLLNETARDDSANRQGVSSPQPGSGAGHCEQRISVSHAASLPARLRALAQNKSGLHDILDPFSQLLTVAEARV